jgi:phospho-N-acetylmuramoyl-pentapeptide-transferase
MLREILQTAGLSFAIAVFIAPPVIRGLKRLKFGQKILEDGPTWHAGKQNTPTMGGVIFILALAVTVLSLLPHTLRTGDLRPLLMLGLSAVFGAIGFVDDWTKIRKKRNKGITAAQKLLLQTAAAALFVTMMRAQGFLVDEMRIPFTDYAIAMPWPVYLIITVVIIVGADNAVNLTDGIDGLCSGVTLIIAVFFSVVFMRQGSTAGIFSLALAGGLTGFFLFNKHPARVFMGDTGSLFLGGAVCAMAFAAGTPLILALVGLVYIVEALSDIIQVLYYRKTGGKRFFKMAPIHHHFEMIGWSEWRIVAVFCGVTALLCLISLWA